MVSATARATCRHCGERPTHGKRPYCSSCYKAGVRRGVVGGERTPDPSRPICVRCGVRNVITRASGSFASYCYRCKYHRPATIPPIERPGNLVDTGLRVDDRRKLLVHPDGRRTRVPPTFVFEYFFETVGEEEDRDGLPLILRVLRPVGPNKTGESNVA